MQADHRIKKNHIARELLLEKQSINNVKEDKKLNSSLSFNLICDHNEHGMHLEPISQTQKPSDS